MDFLTWGRNPWGQQILTHVSWDLLWASLFAGLMFLVAHASYMMLSAHRKRSGGRRPTRSRRRTRICPSRFERHSFMARMFHWVMAASMFVLLFTAFLPIVGVQVRLGPVALDGGPGADRLDHLPHHPRDVLPRLLVDLGRSEGHPRVQGRDAARARTRRARARSRASIRSATASTTWRSSSSALPSSITGMLMMYAHPDAALRRAIRTCMTDATWGFTYVAARPGRRRPGRPGDRARLLRGPAREVVDHQEHDLRLDHAPAVPRAPRSRRAGRSGRQAPRRPRVSVAPATLEEARTELNARCNAIEECYEFMLAYAAQGLDGTDQGSGTGSQVREFLDEVRRGAHGPGRLPRPASSRSSSVESADAVRGVHGASSSATPATPRRPCSSCWRSRPSARSWSTT